MNLLDKIFKKYKEKIELSESKINSEEIRLDYLNQTLMIMRGSIEKILERLDNNDIEIQKLPEIQKAVDLLTERFNNNDPAMQSLFETQKTVDSLMKRFNDNDLAMQSLFETQKTVDSLVERLNDNDLAMHSLFETQKTVNSLVERLNDNDLAMQSLFETQKTVDSLVERFNDNDLAMQSLFETQKTMDSLMKRFNDNDLVMQSLFETQKTVDSLVERFNDNDLTMQSLFEAQKQFYELKEFIVSLNIKDALNNYERLAVNVRNNNSIITSMRSDQNVLKLENGYGFSMFNKITNSQAGEDAILAYATSMLKIPFNQCSYVDLGANHPREMSNTYFFYSQGARGVLVEANSELCRELETERKDDIVLHYVVSDKSGETVSFNVLSGDGLSTIGDFKETIETNPDITLERVETVETICYNDIVDKYLSEAPVILNLDVEGIELDVLRAMDFKKKRPMIIIVEMIPYSTKLVVGEKNADILDFMQSVNYIEFAFTGINSIFIDKEKL